MPFPQSSFTSKLLTKKRTLKSIAFIVLILLPLSSCSDQQSKNVHPSSQATQQSSESQYKNTHEPLLGVPHTLQRPSNPQTLNTYILSEEEVNQIDAEIQGRRLAKKHCEACHDPSTNKMTKIGPPLWGIYQAKAGASQYEYSKEFMQQATLGLIWGGSQLDQFIQSPNEYLKNTKMSTFKGVKIQVNRLKIIAFLRSLQ